MVEALVSALKLHRSTKKLQPFIVESLKFYLRHLSLKVWSQWQPEQITTQARRRVILPLSRRTDSSADYLLMFFHLQCIDWPFGVDPVWLKKKTERWVQVWFLCFPGVDLRLVQLFVSDVWTAQQKYTQTCFRLTAAGVGLQITLFIGGMYSI